MEHDDQGLPEWLERWRTEQPAQEDWQATLSHYSVIRHMPPKQTGTNYYHWGIQNEWAKHEIIAHRRSSHYSVIQKLHKLREEDARNHFKWRLSGRQPQSLRGIPGERSKRQRYRDQASAATVDEPSTQPA